jgi:hypothetical protein
MWERAMSEAREAVALGDRSFMPHVLMAGISGFLGSLAEARQHADEAWRIAPWSRGVAGTLAAILENCGDKEGAARLRPKFAEDALAMFLYHAIRAETDAAIDWYEKMIEQRLPHAPLSAFAASCKPLRESLRWKKLAKMMNLPESS